MSITELNKLIKEIMNERSSTPLDKEKSGSFLRYKKGDKVYHDFDNSNSHWQSSTPDRPARKNLDSLSSQDSPDDKLDLRDIKKVLYNLTMSNVGSIRPISKYRDWLFLSKKDIAERGTSDEKKYWNASLDLLIDDYMREKDTGRSRYQMYSKVRNDIILKNYKIEGVKSDQKHYKNNWLQVEFDPDPAAEMDIDFPEETPTQIDADLFNINIANSPSEIGQFPAGVANSADTVFRGAKNLVERMKVVTQISKEFAQPRAAATGSPEELSTNYAKVVFQDYMNDIMRNMDDRASAYLFESFLALCAGGRVEGAQAGEESSQMGATDFTIGKSGLKGSCKYYSDYSGISQAASGFTSNEPMHYIVGLKVKEKSKGQKVVKGVTIFYFKIVVTKGKRKTTINYFAPNGQKLATRSISAKITDIPLNFKELYGSETDLGDIILLGDDREEYKETIKSSLSTMNTNLADLVSKTSNISNNSRSMNRNVREYIMKDDSTSGDQAVGDINRIIEDMQSLYNLMSDLGFTKTEEEIKAAPVAESKITEIDSLIAEAIRDMKKSKK